MEILIERKNIPYLRQETYRKVEVLLQNNELRIHLYYEEDKPTIFVMIEAAKEDEIAQVQKCLGCQ